MTILQYSGNNGGFLREHRQSDQTTADDPASYKPDEGLVNAVNVALLLGKPLLLTGEPGTGKTQLAYSVAWELSAKGLLPATSARVLKFETKSTSASRDLFYTFDVLARFHAAHSGGSEDNLDYLTFGALGEAILQAQEKSDALRWLPPGFVHDGPRRSVVLIDEIDKAPRDFPNDLLNEIEDLYFRIPELQNARIGGSDVIADVYRPIIFLTSNSEKNLPDPFLRRCIYYHIPFPDRERLHEILLARLASVGGIGGPLIEEAIDFFLQLRNEGTLKRKSSPAELIHWLVFLLTKEANPREGLEAVRRVAHTSVGTTLAKEPEDQLRVTKEFETYIRHDHQNDRHGRARGSREF
jgi:MoxR-like ATPase